MFYFLLLKSVMIVKQQFLSEFRFLDLRSASYAHEYKCALSSAGRSEKFC